MQSYPTKNLGHGLGSLEQQEGSWKFRFRATVISGGKAVRKQLAVRIGKVADLSQDEAIAAAHSYRVRFRAEAVAPLRSDDLPLAKDFLPPGVPPRAAYYGAVAEQIAVVNLLSRGMEVFRNVNASGSVDLVAMGADRILYRIEVKSGGVLANGARHDIWKKVLHRGAYDVLAVVTHTWKVYYFDVSHAPISFTRDGIMLLDSGASESRSRHANSIKISVAAQSQEEVEQIQ